MPTFYKPTQMRGKRVVFQTLDPDEKKNRYRPILLIVGFIIEIPLIMWLTK